MGAEEWEGLGEEGPYTHIRTVEYCELNIKMSSIFSPKFQSRGKIQPSQGVHYLQGLTLYRIPHQMLLSE